MSTKVIEAQERLKAGIATLVTSDEWQRYLRFQARFHRYSFSNTLLILQQRADATHVAGYRAWQTLGRNVKRGEKSIWILAPIFRTEERRNEAGDVETIQRPLYRAVGVFDVAQTEGAPVPESPAKRLQGESDAGRALLESLRVTSPVPIATVPQNLLGAANGDYDLREHKIRLSETLLADQAAKTLAHELAHHYDATSHALDDKNEAEVVAEAAAYCVAHSQGLDTSGYTFGYIASWKGDPRTISHLGGRIQRAAHQILQQLDNPTHNDLTIPTSTADMPANPAGVPA